MEPLLEPFSSSLVRGLYKDLPFEDSFTNQIDAVDVIIPLLHSNDLWSENLKSFYREIPIRQLIVGDAGCIDGSLDVLANFPRVKIIDQKKLKTLGTCLAQLIENVETDRFIYLQSDVYLPKNWYQNMLSGMEDADWVGCPMQLVVITDYRQDYSGQRPLAGAQIGNTKAFSGFHKSIDDDYVYRQEDFILDGYIKSNGGKSINNDKVFHFHQLMRRNTTGETMDIKDIKVISNQNSSESKRVRDTQLFGYMKYLDISNELARNSFKNQLIQELNDNQGKVGHLMNFDESKPGWKKIVLETLITWYLKNILRPIRDLTSSLNPLIVLKILINLLDTYRKKSETDRYSR